MFRSRRLGALVFAVLATVTMSPGLVAADGDPPPVRLAAAEAPLKLADGVEANFVHTTYATLLASGCDVEAFGVRTPLEARVLRNTPYAVRGYQFRSPELGALYARDGSWYHPRPGKVTITGPDASCVKRLKQHEKALRKTSGVNKALEAVMTADRRVYQGLRFAQRELSKVKHAMHRDAQGTVWWHLTMLDACGGSGTPEEKGDCAMMVIKCKGAFDARGRKAAGWTKTVQCEVQFAG